jgi:hypothetical protein
LKVGSDTRAFSGRAIGAKEKCQDERLSMAIFANLGGLFLIICPFGRKAKMDLPAETDDGSFGP